MTKNWYLAMEIKNVISIIKMTSLLKTLYLNFHYLPLKQAIKFPVLVSKNFCLKINGGSVIVPSEVKYGKIRLGYGTVDIFDRKRSRGIWKLQGKLVFAGKANIGHGVKIVVAKDAVLQFGENINITAESQILVEKNIKFGNDCLISWDCLFSRSLTKPTI